MLAIITGDRGTGKTALCRRLADRAGAAGWHVAGILSLAVMSGGQKTAIEAQDLRTGEFRLLARRRAEDTASSGLHTPAWVFDESGVSWGNCVLEESTPCDLLVVDELGPLELERGQGWTAGISAVHSGEYRHAVVVVRPELLSLATTRWPHAQVVSAMDADAMAQLEQMLASV
jgi:nucleoside-triphosphatase THEP1